MAFLTELDSSSGGENGLLSLKLLHLHRNHRAGLINGTGLQHAAQVVHDQGRQGFALDHLGARSVVEQDLFSDMAVSWVIARVEPAGAEALCPKPAS